MFSKEVLRMLKKQVGRADEGIDRKRRATHSLHLPPLPANDGREV